MARTRRYRRYRRSSKQWSTRLTSVNVTQLVSGNQTFFIFRTLATNPVQDDNTVSQRFTVKNINCQLNVEAQYGSDSNNLENFQEFILFIPQGYTLTSDTPYEHPEWIMAHRFLGSPQNDSDPGYLPARISTRLARKLDTGDRVVFLLIGTNTGQTNQTIRVDGLIKLNTKAN